MNKFFDDLSGLWVEAAERRGAKIEPPRLDPQVAEELLELARVAAHTQERRFAPLTSYMAGVAASRLAVADSSTDIAAFVREVREKLEAAAPSER